jgi:hypothetical protein
MSGAEAVSMNLSCAVRAQADAAPAHNSLEAAPSLSRGLRGRVARFHRVRPSGRRGPSLSGPRRPPLLPALAGIDSALRRALR